MTPEITLKNTRGQIAKRGKIISILFLLALISAALLGTYMLWCATPFGLGLVNDSASYVNGAANLLAGDGYTRTSGGGELKPITHFPPLFSVLLAMFHFTGLSLITTAHVLILIFFALTILLAGYLVFKVTDSITLSLLVSLLIACSDTILGVYDTLMSEPLFIVLMLSAILTIGQYYKNQHLSWIVFTGVLLGLAYLTRFAALSLIAAMLTALVILSRPRLLFRAGFLKPAGALLVGVLPFVLGWSRYNWWIAGEVGNRTLLFHPIPAETLFNGLKNLLTWLAPKELLAVHPVFCWSLSALSLLVPIILLGFAIQVWRSDSQKISPAVAITTALSLHILVYLAFLITSISLFDASTPLDDRILSIIYVPEMILFGSVLGFILKALKPRERSSPATAHPNRKWQVLVYLFCLALAVFSLRDGIAAVKEFSRDGQGFNHSGWRNSAAIEMVRQMSPITLYSNRPTAIYLLTGKSAYIVPTPIDAVTTLNRPNFDADVTELRGRVISGKAALVLFDMKNDPESADLYALLTGTLPLLMDNGREQIFALQP